MTDEFFQHRYCLLTMSELVVAGTINARIPYAPERPDLDAIFRLLERPEWHRDALCKEHPEMEFFPGLGQDWLPAVDVCARCLVADECLSYALADPALEGIWGGTTMNQRRQVRQGLIDLAHVRAGRDAPESGIPSCAACRMPLSKKRSACSGCGAVNPHHRAA